ncbi:zinc ribbon domain-containing protein [Klebsiella michiganensis]|uniref:zinc ribbon domain-containing protein n=1 Tax=Klebsiella michiganensis TaxID=1134687 RepID=UPI001CC9EC63|nr:zinc ribbon domain-containing protein [Klebsiella michiganensis]
MAMKKCRECGHSVSSSAKMCPSCGVKKPYISPLKGVFLLAVIGWTGWIAFTDDKSSGSNQVSTESASASMGEIRLKTAAPVNLAPASTTPFTTAQVCKAAISGIFGRDVNTLKAAKGSPAGVFKISYRRPSDGNQYSFDCKLSGNNVIWTETGQTSNRWNGSGSVEFNVEFAIKENVLVITEAHGNSDDISYRFTMNQFR